MKQSQNLNQIWLPILFAIFVTIIYAFRRNINALGFPVDPYFLALFGFPIILLVLKRISFLDLGLKIGKPLYGLFFILLLPGILFLRYYLMGIPFRFSEGFLIVAIGSVAEEFFFRGYVQGQFRRFGSIASVVIAGFFFALVHFVKGYSLLGTVSIFAVGLYFGAARDDRGGNSIIYPMGAHVLYNLIVTSMRNF